MKDIVRILEYYFVSNGVIYHYGQKANLNLLSSDTDFRDMQPYFLHNKNKRITNFSVNNRVTGYTFTGDAFLVVKSSPDMPYYKELQDYRIDDNGNHVNKYETNIEPLLEFFKGFAESGFCADYTFREWTAIDVVDLMDVNFDGLYITYTITVDL